MIEYWKEFKERAKEQGIESLGGATNWARFGVSEAISEAYIDVYYDAKVKPNIIGVAFKVEEEERGPVYAYLKDHSEDIEWNIGDGKRTRLAWYESNMKHSSSVATTHSYTSVEVAHKEYYIQDRESWADQHQWLLGYLVKFRTLFGEELRLYLEEEVVEEESAEAEVEA